MQCVRIDTVRGRLRVSSAGHPFPVRYAAARRKSDRLLVRGPLLNGAESDARQYDVRSAEIEPGDILVLVSDGLTESSRADDPYGYRFVDVVEEHASESARSIGERIIADWRRHSRNPDWIDDVSVVVAVISRSGGSDEH
jgi:serine phosphatase RsbU (regulator of sigma subunit)